MESDFDLALTLFTRVMILIRGLLEDFMGYWQVMARLIVQAIKNAMWIVYFIYLTVMLSVLAGRKLLEMHCTVFMT